MVSDLILIEVDSQSLKQLALWPWPRSYHAKILQHLKSADVSKVFFDIDFSVASNPEEDIAFAQALGTYPPGTVLLPTFLQYTSNQADRQLSLTQPLAIFAEHAIAVSVSLRPDTDGLVRRIKLFDRFADIDLFTAPSLLSEHDLYDTDLMLIDFSIDPSSFIRISYADVYIGNYPPQFFAGKKVIVGATALELSDQIPVPNYLSIAGPIIQAMAYQTLSEGKLKPLGRLSVILVLGFMQLIIMLFLRNISWRIGLFLLVLVATGFILISSQLYAQRILLDTAPLIVMPLLSFLILQFARIDRQAFNLIRQGLRLSKQEALMSNVVENTSEGILTLETNGLIKSINSAGLKMFGYTSRLDQGSTADSLIPDLSGKNLLNGNIFDGLVREDMGRTLAGDLFPIEFTMNKLQLNDEQLYTLFVRDITERKARQIELTYQATHDSLTGLLNRAALKEQLQLAVSAHHEKRQSAALLFVDLDRFKEINDTLGHGVGDQILQELGLRLKVLESDSVTVARIGGDEFAILTTDNSSIYIEKLISSLFELIEKPFAAESISLQVNASVGVALLPTHTTSEEELMMFADVAMYQAKVQRLNYLVYDASLNSNTLRNLAISSQLNLAVEAEEFVLFYQPKVDINSGEVICLEALVRWVHPTLGMVSPDDFINVAERSGMIKPLTLYTMKQAMIKCQRLRAQGHEVLMAVNLSAFLLQDVSLVADLAGFMEELSVNPQWLEFEITESAIVADPEHAIGVLKELRDLGLRLSIDDFGTGYASLAYLKQLPVHELKLDKLFIQDLLDNKGDQIIVRSTIELAHSLSLTVVAEGVESEEICNFLREADCDMIQGYWISRPLASGKLESWLEQWHWEPSITATAPTSGEPV
ncbi:MAG: EAL domain-containing protein [Porticoccaceae bacterium]|nr:EAL domain-containing protein [Porticoccaceae bacterium]